MNKLFILFIVLIFAPRCFAQSGGASAKTPSWKIYYDSTQSFWDKDWNKTVALLKHAEQYAIVDLGIYDENYLTIISDLGLAYWRIKDYSNADKLLSKSLALKKEIYPSNSNELYGSMNNLAGLYTEQGKALKAKSLYKNILVNDPLKIEPDVYNTALKNLLALYETQGDLDSVLYLLDANQTRTFLQLHNADALPYELDLVRGRTYRKQKKYNEASALFDFSISKLYNQAGKTFFTVYIKNLQEGGLVYIETGLYSKAEKNFLQAYRLLKAHPLPDNLLLTTLLNNLAYVYDKLNIYDKALAYYEESLSLCQLSYSINSLPCATLQNNIAGIYLKQGNHTRAINSYEILLKNFEGLIDDSSPLYITTLNNLATAYRSNNQYDKAALYLDRAFNLVKKYKLEQEDIAATIMNNMAVLNTALGDLSKAATYYEKAYAIKKSIYGEQSVLLLDLISNMAIVYWALHNSDLALPLFDKSMELSIRQIKYVFPNLNEGEQVQFYKKLKEDFERYNTVAVQLAADHPQLLTQMFNNQIMIKSLMFFTQKRRSSTITSKHDSVLNAQYELLKSKQEQLGYFYQLPLKELKRANISLKTLEDEIDNLEKSITLKTTETSSDHMLSKNIEWADVYNRIQPDEALIEIVRFRKYDLSTQLQSNITKARFGFTDSIYYAALITTKETTQHPVLITLKEGNNMETRFLSYYKNALTFDVSDQNSYPFYWKPFENALQGKTKIFFSGDGVYHKLNLNTLRKSENEKYILQRYDIHQLLNPAQFVERKKLASSGPLVAVLIGDPIFDTDISSTSKSRDDNDHNKFSSLPGTYAEIMSVDEILKSQHWKTTTYLKANATEKNLKKVHSPSILHIATHGFFSTDIVALNEEAKKDFLFHSGIILSGANKHIDEETQPFYDDGIVTAYEVMNLDLNNTDLVVLSACETGLGKIENGEGVYGLQRSFLQAGAKNIMISLWKVDDELTKELMIKFYTYLSTGISKHESLKLAQLDQMKHVKDPMLWGGFVLVGSD